MTFGDPFGTSDTVDQVQARYDGGANADHQLVQRDGEQNPASAPIYTNGVQLTDEIVAAAMRRTPAPVRTVTASDVEVHASIGSYHYMTSPTDLQFFGAKTTFGTFGFAQTANNTILYSSAHVATTVAVAADINISFTAPDTITDDSAGGLLAGATAGGWFEVAGSAANSQKWRVLSQPDNNTIIIDPDSGTITTEIAGPAITITALSSVQLEDNDMNPLVDEAPGAAVTLTFSQNVAGNETPLFAAVKDLGLSIDPFQLFNHVFVEALAFSSDGTGVQAFDVTLGSDGGADPVGINPFTGTITIEDYDRDDAATKPATAAEQASTWGNSKGTFFAGSFVCFTALNWTIANAVDSSWCHEEVVKIAEDAGKPTFELDGTIYQTDGDTWRQDSRNKRFDHFQQRFTSTNYRNGIAGAGALVLDIYRFTLTDGGAVATGVDAEALEHNVTGAMAGEPTASWGAMTSIRVPAP
jgi:hypothetical protein